MLNLFNKEKESTNIVIIGHIDHGKSTLIGRIIFDTESLPDEKIEEVKKASGELGEKFEFAFLLDHLKEERENYMTIDTTQTFFQTKKRKYVIIDAPGHVEFIKNMITGATQAEVAVLIVDAKEGLKEQTKRHAYIISMLGLSKLFVAINKMDLVDYNQDVFKHLEAELAQFLDLINISAAYFIPISAKNGDNVLKRSAHIPWYKGPTLLEALDSLKLESEDKHRPLRFPIQDIYTINKEKIAVGKIESGAIKKGERLLLLPQEKEVGIQAIKVFNKNKDMAETGENIGITFSEALAVERGNIICDKQHLPKISHKFKANVFWMSGEDLKVNQKVIIRCATQELEAIVESIEKRLNSSTLEILEDEADAIRLNEVARVTFKSEKPIVLEEYHSIEELGRIVIEDKASGDIQGAGIIKEL